MYRYWYSALNSGAFKCTSFNNSLEITINKKKFPASSVMRYNRWDCITILADATQKHHSLLLLSKEPMLPRSFADLASRWKRGNVPSSEEIPAAIVSKQNTH